MAPLRLEVVPRGGRRPFGTHEHKLHHEPRRIHEVGKTRVQHVEVGEHEGPGLDELRQNHRLRCSGVGEEVASRLQTGRPHRQRRLVWEVEPDQEARQVVARP